MKYKILIVDDSFSSRSLLKNIIKKNHDFCELIGEAKNGQEAINMYKDLQPDLITMDLSMPVKNGVEATKEILEMNPKAKIVVVTGTTDETLIDKVKSLGIENVIAKPFQSNALIAVLKDLIAKDGEVIEEEEFSIATPSKYKPNINEVVEPSIPNIRPIQEPINHEKTKNVVENETTVNNKFYKPIEPAKPIVNESINRPQETIKPIVNESINRPQETIKPIVNESIDKPQQPIRPVVNKPVYEPQQTTRPIVNEPVYKPQETVKPIVNESIDRPQQPIRPVVDKPVYEPQQTTRPIVNEPIYQEDEKLEEVVDNNIYNKNQFVINESIDDEDNDDDEYTPPLNSLEDEDEDDDDEYTPVQHVNETEKVQVFEEKIPVNNLLNQKNDENYLKNDKLDDEVVENEPSVPFRNRFQPVSTEKESIVEEDAKEIVINPNYEVKQNVYSLDKKDDVTQHTRESVTEEHVSEIVIDKEDDKPEEVYSLEKEEQTTTYQPIKEIVEEKSATSQVYQPTERKEIIPEKHIHKEDDDTYKEVYKPINQNADEDIIPLPNIGQGVFVPQYEDKNAFSLSGTSKQLEKPVHWEDEENVAVDEMNMALPGQKTVEVVQKQEPKKPAQMPPNAVPNRNAERNIPPAMSNQERPRPSMPVPPTQHVPTPPLQNKGNTSYVPEQQGNRVTPPRPDRMPAQPPRPPMPSRDVAPPIPSREVAQPPRNTSGHPGHYGSRPMPSGMPPQQQNAPYYQREEQGRMPQQQAPVRQVPIEQNYPAPMQNEPEQDTKKKGGGLFGFLKGLFGKK